MIYSGIEGSWTLPDIHPGNSPLTSIQVIPDELISKHLSFEKAIKKVTYDGLEIGALVEPELVYIDITLASMLGEQEPYK